LLVSEARFGHLVDIGIIGIIIADTFGNIHEATTPSSTSSVSHVKLTSGKVGWADMTPPELRT